MIRFRKWKTGGGLGSDQPGTSKAYSVEVQRAPGSLNSRQIKLWRADNLYPGQMDVYRDTESGGVVLRFDALRHGAKEPRAIEIVDPGAVDKLILSLLEVRSGEWITEGERRWSEIRQQ